MGSQYPPWQPCHPLDAQYIHVMSKPRFLLRIQEFARMPTLCRNLLITVKLLIGTSCSKALTTSISYDPLFKKELLERSSLNRIVRHFLWNNQNKSKLIPMVTVLWCEDRLHVFLSQGWGLVHILRAICAPLWGELFFGNRMMPNQVPMMMGWWWLLEGCVELCSGVDRRRSHLLWASEQRWVICKVFVFSEAFSG